MAERMGGPGVAVHGGGGGPAAGAVVPVGLVPWLTGIVGAAGIALQVLPEHTIAWRIASIVMSLGAVLGLASPGWRR